MAIVKVTKMNCKGEKFGERGFKESKGKEYLEKEVVANSINEF